jgi:hypothetical protein
MRTNGQRPIGNRWHNFRTISKVKPMMNCVGGSATILDSTIFFDNKRLTFFETYSSEGAGSSNKGSHCDDVLNKRTIILAERIESSRSGYSDRSGKSTLILFYVNHLGDSFTPASIVIVTWHRSLYLVTSGRVMTPDSKST